MKYKEEYMIKRKVGRYSVVVRKVHDVYVW
jgi:hypothetical protein